MKKRLSSEDKVKNTVVDYLKQSFKDGFYTDSEWHIQIGSNNGFADVVLLPHFDGDSSIVAIVECKGVGRDTDAGIKQLKAYLSATDTRLGIFANSMNKDEWHYIENMGRSVFKKITRLIFEKYVEEDNWRQRSLKSRIQKQTEILIDREAKKQLAASESLIQGRAGRYTDAEARKRVTEKRISRRVEDILFKELEKAHKQLREVIESFLQTELIEAKRQLQELQGQLQEGREMAEKRLWSAFLGWALFIMTIILLFIINTG